MQQKWIIDPSHSEIEFSVKHLMISKVKGTFEKFSGEILTDGTPQNTTITVTIHTDSIHTNDTNRDAHLKSEDFFNTEEHPTATFTSTSITPTGDNTYLIDGNLTIKNHTNPVQLQATLNGTIKDMSGVSRTAAEGTTRIDRTDYGLTWNQTLETGGILVGEQITLNTTIQASLN